MFLDEATITVVAGAGGRGCVSWRREKFVPKGGPDGGNGGKGGDVVIMADANTDTLSDFVSRKKFEAEKGRFGSGQNRAGRAGDDLVLLVPPGTVLMRSLGGATKEHLADLVEHGDRIVVARGGRGGYGNAHFKSSVRQRPDFAELGEPGEKRTIHMELKLVADVGIIGFPSVGKSTLISVISSAKPKIADYPFTTLVPNLGVVHVDDRQYVVCDVPGLIEGAHEGKGLGHEFLKHVERCGVLLHVLDASHALDLTQSGSSADAQKLIEDYRAIRKELEAHSPTLAAKKELVILNKIDMLPEDDWETVKNAVKKEGIELFAMISAATTRGTEDLKKSLLPIVLAERERRVEASIQAEADKAGELAVLRPQDESLRMGAYRIEQQRDGSVVVYGKRLEQLAAMTDFGSEGAVRRFKDVLERIGLLRALKKWKTDEVSISIGNVRIEGFL